MQTTPLEPPEGGIYVIRDATTNPLGCDSEGDSVLGTLGTGRLFIRTFGTHSWIVLCNQIDDCRTSAAQARSDRVVGGMEVMGVELPDLHGIGFAAGQLEQGLCSDDILTEVRLTMTDPGELRIERRRLQVPSHPAVRSECAYSAARALIQEATCTELTVFTATFESSL